MLAKRQRLTRSEFKAFFPRGKRLHSPHLTVLYVQGEVFKASAVISKKMAHTAVLRNKFRRRVYAVFEGLLVTETLRGTYICIAKEKAANAPFDVLRKELTALIHKRLI